MDAFELLMPDGKPSGVYACGKCRSLWSWNHLRARPANADGDAAQSEHTRKLAEQCCGPKLCCECGAVREKDYYAVCDACASRREAAARAERFEKAEKLTPAEWGASDAGSCMLYDEATDKWFRDTDEAEDWYAGSGFDRPACLWCTTPVRWMPDASGYIADQVHDNFHEGAADQIVAAEYKRLDEFVDAWWGEQGVASFDIDYSRCVLLSATPE